MDRPRHASDVQHPWPLRLWWAVRPAVAYLVAALALLAGAALIALGALSG